MKKCQWILIVFVVLLLPLGLNWIVLSDTPSWFVFDKGVVGDDNAPTVWLSFWVTYISVCATLLMVYYTKQTLNQNQEQLDELKLQWEEQDRPRLNFSIDVSQMWYVLKISNVGKRNAYNIDIRFNDEFINNISDDKSKKMFCILQDRPFAVASNNSEYCYIGGCAETKDYWRDRDGKLKITGNYCDGKYKVDEIIDIKEYTTGGLIVEDTFTTEFQYFKKGVIVQNDQYMPIQKSLDMIAKKVDKIKI